MGQDPPYLYDAPGHYSANDPFGGGFDPKRFTKASFATSTSSFTAPKQHGSLSNFNMHPDSYVQAPYGLTNAVAMPSNTKRNVQWTKNTLLALRSLQLLGAAGLLFCAIVLINASTVDTWIIRVTPSVDIAISLYAVYHLSRAVNGRTPASSASYQICACVLDICLIPFFVLSALMVQTNLNQEDAKDRWSTLLKTSESTFIIVESIGYISAVSVGLHLFSLVTGVYLFYKFRQIMQLPPDFNPLEDNLTSRRKTMHKHKISDMSSSTISEKHDSAISIKSTAEQGRPLAFFHTRESSNDRFSGHNLRTAQMSRESLSMPVTNVYSQPNTARQSRIDLHRPQNASEMSFGTIVDDPVHLGSLGSSVYSDQDVNGYEPPLPRKSSKRKSDVDDYKSISNTIYPSSGNDTSRDRKIFAIEEDKRQKFRNSRYDSKQEVNAGFREPKLPRIHGLDLAPLRMNPPTPPPASAKPNLYNNGYDYALDESPSRTNVLQSTSGNSSPARIGTPTKTKYYGDLKTAVEGVRESSSYRKSMTVGQGSAIGAGQWLGGEARDYNHGRDAQEQRPLQNKDGKGRVVSRTGTDMGTYYYDREDVDSAFSSRKVSGKVAEEGLGGGWARRRKSGR